MSPRVASVALVSLTILLAGGGCAARGPSGCTLRVEALLGGAVSVRRIDGTTPVTTREAYRVDGTSDGDGRPGPRIDRYRVTAGPVPVDDAAAARLADVLTDDATYDWVRAKACEFAPGVVVRYADAGGVTEVFVCFSCDEVAFHVDGRRTGVEDTDARRADLVAVAKALFPDDARIQGL